MLPVHRIVWVFPKPQELQIDWTDRKHRLYISARIVFIRSRVKKGHKNLIDRIQTTHWGGEGNLIRQLSLKSLNSVDWGIWDVSLKFRFTLVVSQKNVWRNTEALPLPYASELSVISYEQSFIWWNPRSSINKSKFLWDKNIYKMIKKILPKGPSYQVVYTMYAEPKVIRNNRGN